MSYIDGSTPGTRVEIPVTNITNQTTLASIINQINGVAQISASTNPGDGVRAGTDELLRVNRNSVWHLCMSTDGVSNSGEALAGATAYAQASGVDRFSVVGIEDSGNASSLRSEYS